MKLSPALRPRRLLALGLLAAFVAGTGCYGRFPITNAVYRWNGKVTNNTVVNSVIMVVLVIIPVYGICMLIDGIIVNSIEFWSGDRVNVATTTRLADGTEVTLAPGSHDDEAILTVRREGNLIAQRTYLRTSPTHTNILDEQGAILSTVDKSPDGTLVVRNPAGEVQAVYTSENIAELMAQSVGG